MNEWNKLSMKERASYIRTGVKNGLTSLDDIRNKYNTFATGGTVNNYLDAIESQSKVEQYGTNPYNYNLTMPEEEAEKRGYYKDERGHRSDKVKYISHPTHPDRAELNPNNNYLKFKELGLNDVNYSLFGARDNGDGSSIPIYEDSYVLPEITVTPNGNYYDNTYDGVKYNIKAYGGYKNVQAPVISDPRDIKNPNMYEIGNLNKAFYNQYPLSFNNYIPYNINNSFVNNNPYNNSNMYGLGSFLKKQVSNAYNFVSNLGHNVKAITNAVKRKVYNDQESPESEIIDLSNSKMARITPETNNSNVLSILGNDFIESDGSNINTAKYFRDHSDGVFGYYNIPLSNISTYYGIQDGKLRTAPLEFFNDTTTVIPNRHKYYGLIVGIDYGKPMYSQFDVTTGKLKSPIVEYIKEYNNAADAAGYFIQNDDEYKNKLNIMNYLYSPFYNAIHNTIDISNPQSYAPVENKQVPLKLGANYNYGDLYYALRDTNTDDINNEDMEELLSVPKGFMSNYKRQFPSLDNNYLLMAMRNFQEGRRLRRKKLTRFLESNVPRENNFLSRYAKNYSYEYTHGKEYNPYYDVYSDYPDNWRIHNLSEKLYDTMYEIDRENEDMNNLLQYVTENGQHVKINDYDPWSIGKMLLSNPQGNTLFINNIRGLDPVKQLPYINNFLKNNPSYPVILDNGRYSHYYKSNDSNNLYNDYVSDDLWRDPKKVYVFGEVK